MFHLNRHTDHLRIGRFLWAVVAPTHIKQGKLIHRPIGGHVAQELSKQIRTEKTFISRKWLSIKDKNCLNIIKTSSYS